jgi:lycopene cyclase domain-containing protein
VSYTLVAAVAVVAAVLLDQLVVRTRLTSTSLWWSAYGIIVVFQLLTNGWLTGRGIVQYDPDAILGPRILFAPVEDLGFGFALVLTTCVAWVRLGGRADEEPG